MNQEAANREQFNWWLPIHTIAATGVLLLLLFLWSPDADLLYIFIVAPIACLVWLGLIIASAVRRKFRRSLGMLLTLTLFLLVSGTLLTNEAALRSRLRWFLLARYYKGQVISQPIPANGELKHVEWDGWGGAPVGDWTAYVVFDPSDSLSVAVKSNSYGQLKGIPCDVDDVRRLERNWYSVTLSMNEFWGNNCGTPVKAHHALRSSARDRVKVLL
jgi:hypothetical protein